jgi:hypothetical protein
MHIKLLFIPCHAHVLYFALTHSSCSWLLTNWKATFGP